MNGDEAVYESLRKHGSDAEARRCLQCCGADEELQETLREFDVEETQMRARQVLRKFAVDRAMEEARQRKVALDSITESPVWKDPQFLIKLSREFADPEAIKNYIIKHYIDNAGQPARAPNISKMGNPLRGADGQILRDGKGQVIWGDTSAEGQFNPTDVNLRNAKENSGQDCGHCIFYRSQDSACQIVGGSVADNLICDKFTAKPTLEQRVLSVQRGLSNMRADGKIDPTKSIMGNPVRNPDGSVSWVAK
jgi:hypothetical protein